MKKKIGIIGAGAAGMMAAVSLIEGRGKTGEEIEIYLFEKNAYLGAKVLISGGGRCNVTTGIHDIKKLLENYPRGAKFLRTAMYDFTPAKVMEWFESHGVRLKTEEDLRVFPASDNGKDIVGALEKEIRGSNTKIFFNTNVIKIEPVNGDTNDTKFRIITKNESHELDFLILTTGGNAYRHTGSSGDGYAFASSLGHAITKLGPSLSSFISQETWVTNISGVSFEKVELTLTSHDGKQTWHRAGPLLFTHKGVSGPAIFALSSYATYEMISREKPLTLNINFFPEKSDREFSQHFQAMANTHGKKLLINFLDIFLPKSLCEIIVKLSETQDIRAAEMNRELREKIIKYIRNLELKIIGRGTGDEFVTAGGVPLDEVHPNTMESKIRPGLYIAGELLDIDGFTGGFNLQASWATGHLAGKSITAKLAQS